MTPFFKKKKKASQVTLMCSQGGKHCYKLSGSGFIWVLYGDSPCFQKLQLESNSSMSATVCSGFSFPIGAEASRWQLQGQVAYEAGKEQSRCGFLVSVALSCAYGILLMHSALLNSKQEPVELFNT